MESARARAAALIHQARKLLQEERRELAPLDPDAFARWAWGGKPGTNPITMDDLWFELAAEAPELSLAEVRRWFVHLAAKVRRNQRLGLNPWEGMQ